VAGRLLFQMNTDGRCFSKKSERLDFPCYHFQFFLLFIILNFHTIVNIYISFKEAKAVEKNNLLHVHVCQSN